MDAATGAILYLLVFGGIIYFLMIRPQQKQAKIRKELLQNLKVKDKVLTIGGIYGTISKINDDVVYVKVTEDVELKMTINGIGHVVE